MSLQKDSTYLGLSVPNAVYTVEYITIQNSQLDFYVSMRASKGTPILSGDNYGCAYDSSLGTPEEQAYTYLKTLAEFTSAVELTD